MGGDELKLVQEANRSSWKKKEKKKNWLVDVVNANLQKQPLTLI